MSPLSFPPLPDYLAPNAEDGPPLSTVMVPPVRPAQPHLPQLPQVPQYPIHQYRSLRCGCWITSYRPQGVINSMFDGTLRIECHRDGRTASGDLYRRQQLVLQNPILTNVPLGPPRPYGATHAPVLALAAPPNPAAGIPVFPRSQYRYYQRVTALPEYLFLGNNFTLAFEFWRFTAPNTWVLDSTLTASMVRMTAPAGYPSPGDYAEGDVRNAAGALVGRFTMGWVSGFFRKASIEIDTVSGSERPLNSGAGHDWSTVMNAVGWETAVVLSDTNVVQPSGASWSDAEMHAAMLARRAAVNLDTNWRFHILAVKNIDSTPRGIMYDSGGTDSNNVPREGVGIASHWTIDPGWGTVSGMRFGTAPAPYFRTAVHELGHAMGLYHNWADMGFMCTSDTIAAGGTAATPFPNNIQWSFHPDNLKQLRHYPDPFVRPGGVAFSGASNTAPMITPTDLEFPFTGLALTVTPLLGEVPLGAPVRIGYTLTNVSSQPIAVPSHISLKDEAVRGEVVDHSGTVRTFRSVTRCLEDHVFQVLEPGESITDGATLLRGAEGALFGAPGVHTIKLQIHWDVADLKATVTGETTVLVTGVVDSSHAAAAHRVLTTPDVHLVLAIGGDHLTDGIAAVDAALHSSVLRPHYAVIEAKRIGRSFGKRKADVTGAAALLDKDAVMSGSEMGKIATIMKTAGTVASRDFAKKLKTRARGIGMPISARKALDSL